MSLSNSAGSNFKLFTARASSRSGRARSWCWKLSSGGVRRVPAPLQMWLNCENPDVTWKQRRNVWTLKCEKTPVTAKLTSTLCLFCPTAVQNSKIFSFRSNITVFHLSNPPLCYFLFRISEGNIVLFAPLHLFHFPMVLFKSGFIHYKTYDGWGRGASPS